MANNCPVKKARKPKVKIRVVEDGADKVDFDETMEEGLGADRRMSCRWPNYSLIVLEDLKNVTLILILPWQFFGFVHKSHVQLCFHVILLLLLQNTPSALPIITRYS